MTDRLPPIFLVGPRQKEYAKQCIDAALPDHVCIIKQKTRTLEQNALFHAICGDVARQCDYMGKKWPLEVWKVLFISGHAIATKSGAEVVPGLENEFVNIRESSAAMSKSRLSSLVEYCLAWCAENGVNVCQQ